MYNFTDIIYNIDIANEEMLDFTHTNKKHTEFIKILKELNYKRKINLEMLIKNESEEKELEILCKSLYNFINL